MRHREVPLGQPYGDNAKAIHRFDAYVEASLSSRKHSGVEVRWEEVGDHNGSVIGECLEQTTGVSGRGLYIGVVADSKLTEADGIVGHSLQDESMYAPRRPPTLHPNRFQHDQWKAKLLCVPNRVLQTMGPSGATSGSHPIQHEGSVWPHWRSTAVDSLAADRRYQPAQGARMEIRWMMYSNRRCHGGRLSGGSESSAAPIA